MFPGCGAAEGQSDRAACVSAEPAMDGFTTRTYGTSGLDNRPLFGETSARVGAWKKVNMAPLMLVIMYFVSLFTASKQIMNIRTWLICGADVDTNVHCWWWHLFTETVDFTKNLITANSWCLYLFFVLYKEFSSFNISTNPTTRTAMLLLWF